jgi:hypothetical protein
VRYEALESCDRELKALLSSCKRTTLIIEGFGVRRIDGEAGVVSRKRLPPSFQRHQFGVGVLVQSRIAHIPGPGGLRCVYSYLGPFVATDLHAFVSHKLLSYIVKNTTLFFGVKTGVPAF